MADVGSQNSLWPSSLHLYNLTLVTAMENLALDDALLALVDQDPNAACLRFWEPHDYSVVLGRSNQAETEVRLDACLAEGIPVLRRTSGGGTVIAGPGCLCYTLVLPLTDQLRSMGITRVTAELMERTANGLRILLPEIAVCGTSDLVWNNQKFSGNAQRWLRRAFVHHGTLLHHFDLTKFASFLAHPKREPEYRRSRPHAEFVTNLPVDRVTLQDVVSKSWNAISSTCPAHVLDDARQIAATRLSSQEWSIRATGNATGDPTKFVNDK